MKTEQKEKEDFNIPAAYVLEKGEYIKELDSFALALRHKKSGARVLIFSNDDDNKVFSIGFRTPPKDSTGVPHIIEHTVLCGSKNFPAKDPFVELVKGSLNTFLNASTYPDKTLYPVASCNDKDFQNLMHVYMDAVFYPNIYKYEEIFKQEGWHYELDAPDGEITYNGVVYNEMKGAFSSEESVLERFLMSSLFPDNTYGHESGGDPRNIPDLTYEDYLDFHRKFYHPVNSYIYLYGDMDVEEKLLWMDEQYLKDFSQEESGAKIVAESTIPLQQPFAEKKVLEKKYAVAQDADCSEKTYYAYAVAMDITLDTKICKAFDVLSYVLAEQPGAPLKQAFLDAGIGTDVDVDFCDILRQSMFTIYTKNAKPEMRDEFYRIYRETLENLVQNGINRKDIEAAINGMEFRDREADFGMYPKGLLYGMKLMRTWLYDDTMPYDALQYAECYQYLREQLSTDFYEKLIQTYLLDNTHAVLVEMIPEPGMSLQVEQETKQKLQAYKDSLNDEQIQQLIADTKALKAYQEEPTPKEVLEMIPMLAREDIGKKVQPFHNEEKEIAGVKTLHHDIVTNDIVYLSMLFDADELKEYMPQMSFLATLLGYMDTKQHGYREFDTETNFYTGGIAADVGIYCRTGHSDDYQLKFVVSTKVLRSQLHKALELMAEMMFETVFADEKHLREVVAESRSRLKVRLMSAGHQAAAGRALASVSESAWQNDRSGGMGYYQYLVQLDEHFEEEKESLAKGCKELLHKLFGKNKMMISITGGEEEYAALQKELPAFMDRLQQFESAPAEESVLQTFCPEKVVQTEGFTTPAEIQYVAVAGKFDQVDNINMGALQVVRHLLNYDFLWNEVRVKGGAYGVGCRFNREREGYFASYRDPNLEDTLAIYKQAKQYLAQYTAEEREITKTIIGTISGMDTPLTPLMKGKRSLSAYLTGVTEEDLQRERDQVLACDVEAIRSTAEVIGQVAEHGVVCVIGNEQHIRDAKELFDKIEPLQ
ncbi:MAG: insulinase family protein [Lachnospiraceae bacterium]|nr:insulinase family protein [Lachnospiraceae bacterium]